MSQTKWRATCIILWAILAALQLATLLFAAMGWHEARCTKVYVLGEGRKWDCGE